MNKETFDIFLIAMSATALVVFLCLYFIKAGYGMFRTKQWGWSIDNKVGWVLMEAPAFCGMLGLTVAGLCGSPSGASSVLFPSLLLAALFLLHYFQRSFIFPFKMQGKSKMPVAIMMMGVVFNLLNALMQGGGLFWFPNETLGLPLSEWIAQPHAWAGIIVFFLGMGINMHSDHVIRHLRAPGDTKHYLPQKGVYRWVTSGNYFGELLEWTGFAIAAATPAAWVFVWWTAANLVPRAHAIHKHYHAEFGDEALGARRRIIPFIY